jgi:choline dehydrogenase-like flavoprotein
MTPRHFQAIVIGTGFAGAVTACRLVEAGFKVGVLERGRRYGPDDFPHYPTEDLFETDNQQRENFAPPPDFSRWLWSRDQGIYDIKDLDDALSIQAAGYGGGSLIYANVHLRPPESVFTSGWPTEYKDKDKNTSDWVLAPYFDLAAYMLRVSLTPKQLAKTLQMERAAHDLHPGGDNHWFRTPLAIDFDGPHKCEFLARCCLGCEVQAKNTLDTNYLDLAEHPRPEDKNAEPAQIGTLTEVTKIEHDGHQFTVTYNDLLFRAEEGNAGGHRTGCLTADYVFLCAGALNTTELLLRNPDLLGSANPRDTPLGSHYFPNADSLAAVFNCDLPHEADYGPTITSAILYQSEAKGDFSQSMDFDDGCLKPGRSMAPTAGDVVRSTSNGTAVLAHDPLLDWGDWARRAAGSLVLGSVKGDFKPGDGLDIGGKATAKARTALISHEHWFLVQDGGYPPNLEPLVGIFKSPVWMRRNRFVEFKGAKAAPPLRRPPGQRLMAQSFSNSLGGTARPTGSGEGILDRAFSSDRLRAANLLAGQLSSFFPGWFVAALEKDKKELLERASALALPMLGRVLKELSQTVSDRLNSKQLADILRVDISEDKKLVLIRGMLRQGLQILAGSEAAVATKAATALLDGIPMTPAKLLDLLADLLLWSLAYGTTEGNTAIVLINGRDIYRGRLGLKADERGGERLTARLPTGALDSSSVVQEQVLRTIAAKTWSGELRVNPAWTTLGRRLTVHNQGGCPMGPGPLDSVTDSWGEVHQRKGLYVMDAAAFPTSVGVNPSATITAVAEYKIEHFIRSHAVPPQPSWEARDKAAARAWVDQRRADLDPLNQRTFEPNQAPELQALGLTFEETMTGFYEPSHSATESDDLAGIPKLDAVFRKAEDAGIQHGDEIEMEVIAKTGDLARLVSGERGIETLKMSLEGWIHFPGTSHGSKPPCRVEADSFLQLFDRPADKTPPPTRYFRYRLKFTDDGQATELIGLKLLRNSPGLDVWSDTSTLYFELRRGDKTVGRGIMRLPLDVFLQKQLRSIEITGTEDTARKSWALAAFYKYFVTELSQVYVSRAEAIKQMIVKVLTEIHV